MPFRQQQGKESSEKEQVNVRLRRSDRYPGVALNLSKCSKIKRMHVCLNDIALKASESSYIFDTLSSDTSCEKNN